MSAAGVAGWTGAIGSAFQQRAALEAEKAASYKQLEEMNRQKEYAQRAQNVITESAKFKGSDNAAELRKQGEANRLQAFDQVGRYNLFGGPAQVQPGAPTMLAHDVLRNNTSKKNRAVLGSYGDWALRDMIQNIQVQNELNRIGSFAGGSANVIAPAEINAALHSADTWKIVGGTIAGAGNVIGATMAGKDTSPSGGKGQLGSGGSSAPSYTADWGAKNM